MDKRIGQFHIGFGHLIVDIAVNAVGAVAIERDMDQRGGAVVEDAAAGEFVVVAIARDGGGVAAERAVGQDQRTVAIVDGAAGVA
jgi:hypothetical protein